MEEQQPNRMQLLILPAFALAVYGLVTVKNEQTNNFFKRPAQSITRTSLPPDYLDEITRKLAKAEAKRPVGCERTFQPRIMACEEPGEISDMDRSSLTGIIIEGAMQ